MVFNEKTARETAQQLLQIKAIKLQPEEPFTWASGWRSPIYCDNRITLSYPAVRNFLREKICEAVINTYGKPDVIAGVATGAIAIGALVAQELGLPFIYIRPEAKSHGRKNKIEGQLQKGQNVVVVEDLISTGGSSLKAVEAIRENGNTVKGMVGIFTYGFEVARENFREGNCPLVCLSDYEHLLQEVKVQGYLKDDTLATLQEWRKDPANW